MVTIAWFVAIVVGSTVTAQVAAPDALAERQAPHGLINPIAEFQFSIDRAVRSLSYAQFLRQAAAVIDVQTKFGLDGPETTRQIAHYMSTIGIDDPQAQGIAVYSYSLLSLMNISAAERVKGVLPLLEAKNEDLRDIGYSILRVSVSVSVSETGYRPEFAQLAGLFQDHRQPPPLVTLYLFQSDPRAALNTLSSAYVQDASGEGRRLNWADHVIGLVPIRRLYSEPDRVVANAVEQMTFLADHDQWWVRLYVACMLRRHEALRVEPLLAKLRNDKHPFVRFEVDRAAGELPSPPPQFQARTERKSSAIRHGPRGE